MSEVAIVEGYCVKEKAKKQMKDVRYESTKNGKRMAKGTCESCGTKMCKIVKSTP